MSKGNLKKYGYDFGKPDDWPADWLYYDFIKEVLRVECEEDYQSRYLRPAEEDAVLWVAKQCYRRTPYYIVKLYRRAVSHADFLFIKAAPYDARKLADLRRDYLHLVISCLSLMLKRSISGFPILPAHRERFKEVINHKNKVV